MALAQTLLFQQSSADNFGTGVFTTGSFTPPNNCLLEITVFAIEENDTGLEGTSITCDDSAGLTITPRAASTTSPAWSYGIAKFTAPVTTGVSMTLSIDAGAFNVHAYRVEVKYYTGHDTTTPVGATAIGSDADGDGAAPITLNSTPALSSYVSAACLTGLSSASGTVAPGANFTEEFDTVSASWAVFQTQYRPPGVSTSTTVDWADVLATGTGFGGSSLIAIEIREAPASGQVRAPMPFVQPLIFHV